VFWLAAIGILAALFAVIYMLFISAPSFQYPITLALLCFALSSISCLLFAAKADLSGTIGVAAIALGGPAAMWVISLYVVHALFPFHPITTDNLIDIARRSELKNGWTTFPDWMKQLGDLQELINQDEASQVRQVLDSAYYPGEGKKKISDPVIQALYVYVDKQTIRFLRLTGKNPGTADIYFKAHTTVSGGTTSLLLARRDDTITISDTGGKGDWSQVSADRSNPVDCLILTLYDEPMLPQGDLLYMNTTKYLGSGKLSLSAGIIAPQGINKPRVWQVRPFPLATNEIPAAFKSLPIKMENTLDPVFPALLPWMILLDQQLSQKTSEGRMSQGAREFLRTVRNRLPSGSFATFTKSETFTSRFSFRHDEGLSEPVVITFTRK